MKNNSKEAYLPQQIREYLGLLLSKVWTIGVVTLAITLIAIVFHVRWTRRNTALAASRAWSRVCVAGVPTTCLPRCPSAPRHWTR